MLPSLDVVRRVTPEMCGNLRGKSIAQAQHLRPKALREYGCCGLASTFRVKASAGNFHKKDFVRPGPSNETAKVKKLLQVGIKATTVHDPQNQDSRSESGTLTSNRHRLQELRSSSPERHKPMMLRTGHEDAGVEDESEADAGSNATNASTVARNTCFAS